MARKGTRYLILDTETATLPFVNEMAKTVIEKRTLAIAKPLVYDIAWKIVDRNNKVYSEHSYLVAEIFNVPSVFRTAYYFEKRPKYIDRLNNGETTVKQWNEIMEILEEDLQQVEFVGAFNSMFDFKKAIPFTEKYIQALYSSDYFSWETRQRERCRVILNNKQAYKNPDWDGMNFNFRGCDYPLIDLWGIACESLINTQTYKRKCLQHGMITESGQFFKSSAETTFRYLCQKYDFEEMHMAIDDVNIETQILCKALKKGKITKGLQYFPFQMLGKTTKFILQESKRRIPREEVETVINTIEGKLATYEKNSSYVTTLEHELMQLINYLQKHYGEEIYKLRKTQLELREVYRDIIRLNKRLDTLKEGGKSWTLAQENMIELQEKRDVLEWKVQQGE